MVGGCRFFEGWFKLGGFGGGFGGPFIRGRIKRCRFRGRLIICGFGGRFGGPLIRDRFGGELGGPLIRGRFGRGFGGPLIRGCFGGGFRGPLIRGRFGGRLELGRFPSFKGESMTGRFRLFDEVWRAETTSVLSVCKRSCFNENFFLLRKTWDFNPYASDFARFVFLWRSSAVRLLSSSISTSFSFKVSDMSFRKLWWKIPSK